MKTDLFYQIIEEICAELGVSLHMSKEEHIVTLSWAGQEKIIGGRKFEINSIEDTLFASDIPSELLGSIPFENQRVTAGWRYNLSQGSTCILLSNRELTAKIEKLAILASQAVHINFSTVDIIETDSKGLLVLEINSGVVLNKFIDNGPANYDIAKSIYRAAICSMFDGMSPE